MKIINTDDLMNVRIEKEVEIEIGYQKCPPHESLPCHGEGA